MKEYFIEFLIDCEFTHMNHNETEDRRYSFTKGQAIRIYGNNLMPWIETIYHNKLKACIYEAKCVCDLS